MTISYCPLCATPVEQQERHGRVRPVCPACGYVHYVNPLPVAACIAEAAGGLYLIRRRWAPGKDQWALPAGYVELDESPAAAAARETAEETGLRVAVGQFVGIYPYLERGGERGGLVIVYHGQVEGGRPVAGDDAAEVRLFGLDDLPADLAFDTHRAALRDWLGRHGHRAPAWLLVPGQRG